MNVNKSEFVIWFEAQYGKRPSKIRMSVLWKMEAKYENQLYKTKQLLEACEIYDARIESALYAVNAFGMFKDEKVKG